MSEWVNGGEKSRSLTVKQHLNNLVNEQNMCGVGIQSINIGMYKPTCRLVRTRMNSPFVGLNLVRSIPRVSEVRPEHQTKPASRRPAYWTPGHGCYSARQEGQPSGKRTPNTWLCPQFSGAATLGSNSKGRWWKGLWHAGSAGAWGRHFPPQKSWED